MSEEYEKKLLKKSQRNVEIEDKKTTLENEKVKTWQKEQGGGNKKKKGRWKEE